MTISVALSSTSDPETLETCLDAVEQALDRLGRPSAVVVSRPAGSVSDVEDLFATRPWARLLPVEGDPDIPRLRGAAMTAAGGDWVVLTEDIFVPAPDWLERLSFALPESGGVVGGAIGNRKTGPVEHAAYLSDYGYVAPYRPAGEVAALSGSNVAYGPEVRERAADWASAGAWEHVIHNRLATEGVCLTFDPSIRVDHAGRYALTDLMATRYRHGYRYALDRKAEGDAGSRTLRLLAAPILPALMTLRLVRGLPRDERMALLRALPATLALNSAWVAGETNGFLRGR